MIMSKEDMTLFYSVKDKETGYLSNWYPCQFVIDGITFLSSEQYMMYSKATLFDDTEIAERILRETSQTKIKKLGRLVKGFDSKTWDAHKRQIMFDGLFAKFSQNNELKNKLLATGDTVIVECSPSDQIWGIGLKIDDERCLNPEEWKGENLLGYTLMDVRSALQKD